MSSLPTGNGYMRQQYIPSYASQIAPLKRSRLPQILFDHTLKGALRMTLSSLSPANETMSICGFEAARKSLRNHWVRGLCDEGVVKTGVADLCIHKSVSQLS